MIAQICDRYTYKVRHYTGGLTGLFSSLTLLHSEPPKFNVLVVLGAKGLTATYKTIKHNNQKILDVTDYPEARMLGPQKPV